MNKVIVIGSPGSGKSVFSKELHKRIKLPLYHLDNLFWNEDKTSVLRHVFDERLNEILNKDSWIIDGNYARTMNIRMSFCDTMIFLDYETELCLKSVKERMGKKRSDIPWVETEEDAEFIEYIKNFNVEQKPEILKLLNIYSNKQIFVFKTREEATMFLNNL